MLMEYENDDENDGARKTQEIHFLFISIKKLEADITA